MLIERPDGSRVTVLVNIRPLKNDRGEVTGAINCFYDITERKRHEQTACPSRRGSGFEQRRHHCSRRKDDRITYWNKGATKIYGYTRRKRWTK